MKCSDVIEKIPDMADAGFSAEMKKEIETHLRACPSCQIEWQKQEKLVKSLQHSLQDFDPWPDQKFSFRFPPETALPWWEKAWHLLTVMQPAAWIPVGCAALFIGLILWGPFFGSPSSLSGLGITSGSVRECVSGEMIAARPNLTFATYEAVADTEIRSGPENGKPAAVVMQVAAGSRFSLDPGRIRLERGGLYVTHHEFPLSIHLPMAELRMVGTEFLTITSAKQGFVWVKEGRVDLVSPRGSQPLSSGQAGLVAVDAIPQALTASVPVDYWQTFQQGKGDVDRFLAVVAASVPATLKAPTPPTPVSVPVTGTSATPTAPVDEVASGTASAAQAVEEPASAAGDLLPATSSTGLSPLEVLGE